MPSYIRKFFVTERVHREFGDWNYYTISAATSQDENPQLRAEHLPDGVCAISFNCNVETGLKLKPGTELHLIQAPEPEP